MFLKSAFEDTLDVFNDNQRVRIGSVAPSGDDEWAGYLRGVERRIGTYPTIAEAIEAVRKEADRMNP